MQKPDTSTDSVPVEEVARLMQERDMFSKLLGMEIEEVGAGYCRLHLKVREIC